MQRLNRKLGEARRFQDTLAKQIRKMDQDLAKLKAQQSDRKKRR